MKSKLMKCAALASGRERIGSHVKIISGIYWDKGKRLQNQDSVLLEQVITRRGRVFLAAVSDGIGGLSEGENASGYLMEKLAELFYKRLIPQIGKRRGKKKIKKSLLRFVCDMNADFHKYAAGKEIKLGATVSALLIWKNHYIILHLGDSRIYQLKGKEIRQLTENHSDGGNGLFKCLGSFPLQYPDIRYGSIKRNTGFLLCSDGFARVPERTMLGQVFNPKEISNERQIEKRLKDMAAFMMDKGERDNISALYAVCR